MNQVQGACFAQATPPATVTVNDALKQSFDAIWLSGLMTREEAVAWLASELEMPVSTLDFNTLTAPTFARVKALVDRCIHNAFK